MRQQRIEPAAIEAAIARLRSLAIDVLRRRWRAVFGRTPPAGLSKDLLGRMIAWRLQEQAFGGLDRESLTFLDGLARHGGSSRRQLKPGTVLVRDYQGQRHTVTGHHLCEPLRHRTRHHRHGLEWSPVLRPRAIQRRTCAQHQKEKCEWGPQWLASRDRVEPRVSALANRVTCVNPKQKELAVRPYWKGYLKLALVSCPIALHAACSTAERIAFRQINKATGNSLRQQLIDEETREPVAPEHKGRGYEVAKGQYLVVEDAELEAIEIESTHTIEIDSFVPRSQIDQRFLDTPYYVLPSEPVDKRPLQSFGRPCA